jgi:hypothetical protein
MTSNKSKPISYPKRTYSSSVHAPSYRSPVISPTPSSSPSSPSLSSSSFLSGVGGEFVLSLASSLGSSIGSRLTDNIFGPRQVNIITNNCEVTIQSYNEHIKNNNTVPLNIEQQYNECIKK